MHLKITYIEPSGRERLPVFVDWTEEELSAATIENVRLWLAKGMGFEVQITTVE